MHVYGAKLKEIRLSKGISLEDAHRKTKIHVNILQAIEEDNLVNISPVYLKGFLKIYCGFLGVNPTDYIPDFKDTIKRSYIPEEEPAEEKITKMKRPSKPGPRKINARRIPFGAIAAIVALIIALIVVFNIMKAIVGGISSYFESRKRSTPVAVETRLKSYAQEKVLKQQGPQSPAVVSAKPADQNVVRQSVAQSIRLVIRAKEDCYIQLKQDGHTVFQSTLKKNRFETWTAKEKIELSLGNAGAVVLEVNGKPIQQLGRRKQAIKNIVITKDGLNIP
ncbi:MAG TPA: DUF4115 domain-containing protein [Candidatus Omnitrophota bacterium]|nr:DUF4115 domain-containing protein [Candidatus Omnitrophota bacterium]HPT06716.1 DUF4115 domain-containing protein [Candidatus Omnitrophota bacterium]